jgi:hypothetical protein
MDTRMLYLQPNPSYSPCSPCFGWAALQLIVPQRTSDFELLIIRQYLLHGKRISLIIETDNGG